MRRCPVTLYFAELDRDGGVDFGIFNASALLQAKLKQARTMKLMISTIFRFLQ